MLVNDYNEISHTAEYLYKVFQHGTCHMIVFGDGVHWRLICLDGRSKTAYCLDPYGHEGPVSFHSDKACQVLQALGDLLQGQHGWQVQVTRTPWQGRSDGHSCGMWVIWLSEKFMMYVATEVPNPDFEVWASIERPLQADLRARYHDLYYERHPAHMHTPRPTSGKCINFIHKKGLEMTFAKAICSSQGQ